MDRELFSDALKRVRSKKRFYRHLTSYTAVNVVMFFIVMFDGGGFEWLIPASFWSIGLFIHYFNAFGIPGVGEFNSKEWERQEVRKEIEKEMRKYERIEEEEEFVLREIQKEHSTQDFV